MANSIQSTEISKELSEKILKELPNLIPESKKTILEPVKDAVITAFNNGNSEKEIAGWLKNNGVIVSVKKVTDALVLWKIIEAKVVSKK